MSTVNNAKFFRRKAHSPENKPAPSNISPKRTKIRTRKAISNPNIRRQPSARPGSRHEAPEAALYAGFANDDNEVDQGHFGPWVKQHNRPFTKMLSRKLSGSRNGTGREGRKVTIASNLTKSERIRQVRSISVLSRHGGTATHNSSNTPQIDRKFLTTKQEDIQRRNTTFSQRMIVPQITNLQPSRITEVLYLTRSTQLGERKSTLLERLTSESQQLEHRTRIRQYLQQQANKQGTPKSKLLHRSIRLPTDDGSPERRSSLELQSTVLAGRKAVMFELSKLKSAFEPLRAPALAWDPRKERTSLRQRISMGEQLRQAVSSVSSVSPPKVSFASKYRLGK